MRDDLLRDDPQDHALLSVQLGCDGLLVAVVALEPPLIARHTLGQRQALRIGLYVLRSPVDEDVLAPVLDQ